MLASGMFAAPYVQQMNVATPMRDGVLLRANIFLPPGAGHFPAVLMRTPYSKGNAITPNFLAFVN
ncbi:MAG TPA: CocE/NonD family hydrolase, partial [Bryobacteraceae bacterium]|nr:CocE/NonD family hydrolase [Bryobacteraceae bacterium]